MALVEIKNIAIWQTFIESLRARGKWAFRLGLIIHTYLKFKHWEKINFGTKFHLFGSQVPTNRMEIFALGQIGIQLEIHKHPSKWKHRPADYLLDQIRNNIHFLKSAIDFLALGGNMFGYFESNCLPSWTWKDYTTYFKDRFSLNQSWKQKVWTFKNYPQFLIALVPTSYKSKIWENCEFGETKRQCSAPNWALQVNKW